LHGIREPRLSAGLRPPDRVVLPGSAAPACGHRKRAPGRNPCGKRLIGDWRQQPVGRAGRLLGSDRNSLRRCVLKQMAGCRNKARESLDHNSTPPAELDLERVVVLEDGATMVGERPLIGGRGAAAAPPVRGRRWRLPGRAGRQGWWHQADRGRAAAARRAHRPDRCHADATGRGGQAAHRRLAAPGTCASLSSRTQCTIGPM